jgi:hypothetical protein
VFGACAPLKFNQSWPIAGFCVWSRNFKATAALLLLLLPLLLLQIGRSITASHKMLGTDVHAGLRAIKPSRILDVIRMRGNVLETGQGENERRLLVFHWKDLLLILTMSLSVLRVANVPLRLGTKRTSRAK